MKGGNSDAFDAFDDAYRAATGRYLTVQNSKVQDGPGGDRWTMGVIRAEGGFLPKAQVQYALVAAREGGGRSALAAMIVSDLAALQSRAAPFLAMIESFEVGSGAYEAERREAAAASRRPITPRIEAELKAALDAVPAEARPAFVEFHSVSGIGSYTTYKRMYFPTGYMTTCNRWDPARTRPTPDEFARDVPDCSIAAWRGPRGDVELQRGDRWVSVTDDDPTIHAFEAGQRLDIGYSNVGAFGVTMGDLSAGTTGGSGLRMTTDGEIALSSWSSTSTTGSVSSNTTRRAGPVRGWYYVDGHLIAIMDEAGAISRGFIIGVGQPGRLSSVSLNGRLYHDRSD